MDALPAFLRFDGPLWRQRVRATNAIGRRFVEVRHRTRPMGVFLDTARIERIRYAIFTNQNVNQGIRLLFPLTQYS